MTILSLLLLQLLLERLQIPQKGLLKLEKTAVLHATFKGLYPVNPKCPRMDRSSWDSFFMYKHILFTLPTRQNSLVEALCFWKNLCSWKNQKQKVLDKKEKRAVPKKRERVPFCQGKKKKSFVNDYYWPSFTLEPEFRAKKCVKTKFVINKVKNEVSFYLR